MSDPEQTLASIDDTLEQWDQWDGNSPDAARWTGGPDESEWGEQSPMEEALRRALTHSEAMLGIDGWPDRTEQYTYTPGRTLADVLNEQPIQHAPPPMDEPLTVEGMVRVMHRIRDSEPRVFVSPATASAIRQAAHEAGQRVDVIVSEHVPDGQAYVFRPPPMDGGRA